MVDVERAGPEQWERVRALRLAALADVPDAFGRQLADERDLDPAFWRGRLEGARAATFLASIEGRDVGLVTGAHIVAEVVGGDSPEAAASGGAPQVGAGLYSMWVEASARGRGVGDRLVEAVVDWARRRGCSRLLLDVGDDNGPAIGLYLRHGFAPTGRRSCLPPPREHVTEHELALRL
ncbi:GNAT family N-acetyltransferase [Engelhardtia mirabilis]|uniref:Putative acetyltransferase n=1 Tax=Engelhardtia mirabilis TaxID=2528011 RepID=A0A518BKI5_9BACT|nr:putative acetyltransferase [Planctomycetes bacterium Pla133]QDV01808.1 putative acetyltransferase [Planctomycetes bacterium Pla86]